MAKEQLAVIEMVTNMILGKTGGISKVDFVPQKIRCPEPQSIVYENPGQTFPRNTPESQGIHSEHLRNLVEELAYSPDTDMHHFMVLRHGNVICETDFAPYRKGIWHITHSMCKSITGMAAGLLIDEGKLDLSENIYKIFHDKGSTWAKIFRPEVTVENLMTMTSGVTFNESGIVSGNDWLESYLNAPVSEKPGTKFQYNSLNSYVLSAIITERTGMPMDEYLKPRLFDPLGITDYLWEKCPRGITKGGWGLFMHTEDMAKLGQLYLNKGKWNGKQIIPESWAEASVTKKVDSIEGTYGYGYQLWMEERPGSFEYNGMLGQNVLIYPDVDMVIVTNAGNEELFQDNVMLNIIRKYFPVDWMPKETLPENPIAYAKLQELTERLAGKRLKNDQYYNSALIIRKGGWKKNSSKYRVRERQTEIEKAQNQQIHLLTDLLDGTCYEMEQASVGLFPLVMQVMHNNMTDGISKINFYKKRTKELQQTLILCFQEGEESIELEMGWNQYIENKLSIHGETYLVAVKGELSSDVDDNPVLKVEIVYLEEAMRRKLYVTFVKDTSASKLITPEYIEIKWYESPGKALIMEGMESITTEVTKHPIYSRIRENGGIDLLHRLMGQTIEPVIKGRIIDSSEEAQQDTEVQHPEISVD
ncbi:class C beta-lactamase-related serine hydrolase [Dorea longicatena]|uniref:serine hydrolase domain-containing protein n=1 Tax=Dorea longicatena TaxID=88431 RepID=UPI000E4C1128|nr:serine hydrolase [Dorea longicatena]RGU06723.1 class C beta-lactamase-related serine hydrolase [Dorea longicatena]